MTRTLARMAFRALSILGMPIGGVRPRRIYDSIGRRAWPEPSYRWHRNRWGDELWLSPHLHIDRCVLAFGCYDPDLHNALEHLLKPGMICLDVGANFGELALHMARLIGPAGAVHAFEPAPTQFARLSRHTENMSSNIQCHPLALSDRCGTAQMVVPTNTADNQGLGTIVNSEPPQGYTTEEARLSTLDDFARAQHFTRLDFVKLDIQGAEPLFARGGAATIQRFLPLVASEISPADLEVAGWTVKRYCEIFFEMGYNLHRLTRRGIGKRIDKIQDSFYTTNAFFVPVRRAP